MIHKSFDLPSDSLTAEAQKGHAKRGSSPTVREGVRTEPVLGNIKLLLEALAVLCFVLCATTPSFTVGLLTRSLPLAAVITPSLTVGLLTRSLPLAVL